MAQASGGLALVVSGDHAKEESFANDVNDEKGVDDFREEEEELQDKAKDIPDIRKKINHQVSFYFIIGMLTLS